MSTVYKTQRFGTSRALYKTVGGEFGAVHVYVNYVNDKADVRDLRRNFNCQT